MVYCLFVCLFVRQRFLDNPRADSRQSSHAGVLWFRVCLLLFGGLAAPGGRKRGQMKFSLLWESMGNFCILAFFERYLSNACTDPHQILFVYGQCLPTCPLSLWGWSHSCCGQLPFLFFSAMPNVVHCVGHRPAKAFLQGWPKTSKKFRIFHQFETLVHISQKLLKIEAYKLGGEKSFISPLSNCRMCLDPSVTWFCKVGQK